MPTKKTLYLIIQHMEMAIEALEKANKTLELEGSFPADHEQLNALKEERDQLVQLKQELTDEVTKMA